MSTLQACGPQGQVRLILARLSKRPWIDCRQPRLTFSRYKGQGKFAPRQARLRHRPYSSSDQHDYPITQKGRRKRHGEPRAYLQLPTKENLKGIVGELSANRCPLRSVFEQVLANLLKLLVRDAQRLVDIVVERAVELAHLVERRLEIFGAFEQLRLQIDGLAEAA